MAADQLPKSKFHARVDAALKKHEKVNPSMPKTIIHILDSNQAILSELKQNLQDNFHESISIQSHLNHTDLLISINGHPEIMIIGDHNNKILDTLKAAKQLSPKSTFLILSGNDDIGLAIQTFRAGCKDYILKGSGSWPKIQRHVKKYLKISQ